MLWIHASSAARFEESVRDIASRLKLVSRDEPKANHLRHLREWLQDEGNGSWLVILDNADDANFLLQPPATADEAQDTLQRFEYFPSCDHGAMIITSRNKNEALRLVFEDDIVSITPMSEGEAIKLMTNKKVGPSETDNLALVRALDCIPLAITQAVAYIRARGARCSVQQYCKEMEQSRKSRSSLLRRHMPLPNRDKEANNSVLLTWQISFEHIDRTQKSAANLLSMMSFCDRFSIPEVLWQAKESSESNARYSASFEDDIVTLRGFSFISETADARAWEMHRLVQDAMQAWLEDRGRFDDTYGQFIHQLHISFPEANVENWPLCRILFPHAKYIIGQVPNDSTTLAKWARVMFNAALYALDQGDSSSQLEMASNSMTATSKILGDEHVLTLWSKIMVAQAHRKLGHSKEATLIFREAMEISEKVQGKYHLTTLTCMIHLPTKMWHRGQTCEAETLAMTALEMTEREFGKDHLATLLAMRIATHVYNYCGNSMKAKELGEKCLGAMKKVFGEEHHKTISALAPLAVAYASLGSSMKAVDLGERCWEAKKRQIGEDHPDTLLAMSDLAHYYNLRGHNGDNTKAAELQEQCWTIRRKKLGEEHPKTLSSMRKLAEYRRKAIEERSKAENSPQEFPQQSTRGSTGSPENHYKKLRISK